MVISTAVAILSAVTILYYLIAKWRQQYWTRKGVPQLEPNVIVGDYKRMFIDQISLHDFFLEIYQRAKRNGWKHVGIYSIMFPEYVPLDLKQIKQILTKDFHYFGGHGMYHYKGDPFTMNLFSLDGSEWKDRRAKLTPIFTTGKMKMMFDVLTNKTPGLTKLVDAAIKSNTAIDIKDLLARFTTDVIATIAFGLECDTLTQPDHKFRKVGKISLQPRPVRFLFETLIPHELLGRLGYHHQPQEVRSYFKDVVKDAINYREKNDIKRKDFLELMLQLKNQGAIAGDEENVKKVQTFVTDEEIISEAFLFYQAGFETSSSTMTFVFFELAQNPDIQEKLRKEILEVLNNHNGTITYDSLMKMDYLDRVVCETLRKYSILAIIPRMCTKNYKLLDSDIVIEKGTKVHIPLMGLQMDPEYFPNPEKFNPENFTPENKAKRPDFTYMPFGEGPRQCIGLRFGMMQSKIGIISLVKDFRFTLDETVKPPYTLASNSIVYTMEQTILLRATRID